MSAIDSVSEVRNLVDNDLQAFLEAVPLFSSIPRTQLQGLAAIFEPIFLEKGMVVCREGEPGDAMYIIKSGAVGVYVTRGQAEVFVNYLHRGDFFGEMALLVQRERNATIRVLFDAHLYRLRRRMFEQLLKENPSIGLYLSRVYAHRFAQSSEHVFHEPLPTFYVMVATHAGLGKTHFLYSLAYHLTEEASRHVLLVELQPGAEHKVSRYDLQAIPCPDADLLTPFSTRYTALLQEAWRCHASGFLVLCLPRVHERQFWQEVAANLPGLMALLRKRFHLVLFNMPARLEEVGERVIRLCDAVLLLINNTPEALPAVQEKMALLQRIRRSGLEHIKVGVSHLCGEHGVPREALRTSLGLPETPAIWVRRTEAAFTGRIETEKRFPVQGPRALARELGRIRVGLVLGAGGARGWAHLGVLKVLQEESIHIDMIVGTSIGALVGGIYARTASAILTRQWTIDRFPTKRQARRRIFDYTLPFRSFMRGRKIFNMLRDGLGDADFLDLFIPAYIVAVDILTGEEVLLEKGKICEAIMASISIPCLFPPVRLDNRWLMDGGLVNPVPVDVALQKGADTIIAVCVARRMTHTPYVGTPSFMEVLYRTFNIVHSQITKDVAQQADVVIYPEVSRIGLADLHMGQDLMRAGAEACRERLGDIQQKIASKIHQ
jgi:NTE family protein